MYSLSRSAPTTIHDSTAAPFTSRMHKVFHGDEMSTTHSRIGPGPEHSTPVPCERSQAVAALRRSRQGSRKKLPIILLSCWQTPSPTRLPKKHAQRHHHASNTHAGTRRQRRAYRVNLHAAFSPTGRREEQGGSPYCWMSLEETDGCVCLNASRMSAIVTCTGTPEFQC